MIEDKKAIVRAQMQKISKWRERQVKLDMAYIRECMVFCDMLDEDGYPTHHALECIERWPWEFDKQWFEFIRDLWHLRSWGWDEGETEHEFNKGRVVYRYNISTAGWSGNEAIVRAMEKNQMMWDMSWVQSRRGGHYIFELRDYGERDGDSETGV